MSSLVRAAPRDGLGGAVRIAVFGAGGQGCYLAGRLAADGRDVTLVGRGESIRAVARRGIELRGPGGDLAVAAPRTSDTPSLVGEVDLLIVCVKTYDLHEAAAASRPLVGPSTTVLPIQNGVDAARRLGAALGDDRVIGGVSYISAHVEAAGRVTWGGVAGRMEIGEIIGAVGERIEVVRAALENSGIPTTVRDDMNVAIWEKFVLVCATGGVLAYLRAPMGEVLASEEGPTLLRGVMDEAASVGRSRGIPLPDDLVERHAVFVREKIAPTGRSSMLVDLLAGRRLELDALNCNVVRMGRSLGVSTPLNAAVCAALRPYADGTHVAPGTQDR